jgi:pyrroloquinoline-quinone synthase
MYDTRSFANNSGQEMNNTFIERLDSVIKQHDLLCHPFYKAWSAGELTRTDLCDYACNYYHHVEAFPSYLAQLSLRLEDGQLRRAVLANMLEETGGSPCGSSERSHAALWTDFAESMGAGPAMLAHQPIPEVRSLIEYFSRVAQESSPEEGLAAFYAYESQVPRVAEEKARGLREIYGAPEKAYAYFTLHTTADIYHSHVWGEQLTSLLEKNPRQYPLAIAAAEGAAKALWQALDGIERRRMERGAVAAERMAMQRKCLKL